MNVTLFQDARGRRRRGPGGRVLRDFREISARSSVIRRAYMFSGWSAAQRMRLSASVPELCSDFQSETRRPAFRLIGGPWEKNRSIPIHVVAPWRLIFPMFLFTLPSWSVAACTWDAFSTVLLCTLGIPTHVCRCLRVSISCRSRPPPLFNPPPTVVVTPDERTACLYCAEALSDVPSGHWSRRWLAELA